MSKIILSAKSGGDWTDNELTAFNIQVDTVNSATFFNTVQLPAPNVSPVILTNEARPQGILPKGDRLYIHYLRDGGKGEEASVDDFAAFILGMFNYDEPDRIIHNRKELSFVMCGAVVDARPDVCVMSESEYLLLVQEDKRGTNRTDPEPQLVAEAIAAFYQNNLRRKSAGLDMLDSQIIPGITMVGVVPTFYRIPVTTELVRHVQAGAHPLEKTTVQRCIPPVPNPLSYLDEGLVPLVNRVTVMQCFEAFKAFIGM